MVRDPEMPKYNMMKVNERVQLNRLETLKRDSALSSQLTEPDEDLIREPLRSKLAIKNDNDIDN